MQAVAPLVTAPENPKTNFPYFFASFATPIGAFPIAVWASRHPSPVITISASLISSSNFVSCKIKSTPDFKVAFVNVKNANPKPPAAPVPGLSASAFVKLSFAIFV